MENSHEKGEDLAVYKSWTIWTISNWDTVLKDDNLLEKQKHEFYIHKPTQSYWEVGLMVKPGIKDEATFYWKLKEFSDIRLSKIHAAFSFTFLDSDGKNPCYRYRPVLRGQKIAEVNKVNIIDTWHSIWRTRNGDDKDKHGNVQIKIKYFLMLSEPIPSSLALALKTARKNCASKMINNYSSLLNDLSTTDLKIRTNDGLEMSAHKLILTGNPAKKISQLVITNNNSKLNYFVCLAQCPVFATMFRSKFSESISGIIKVDDINGKTMGLILNYLYTGQILPTWRDQDVVVGLTYAAGKYELTEILKMLDNILGDRDEEDASNCDIVLLNLAQKLSLSTAEGGLLKRIISLIEKITEPSKLFDLMGYERENISLRAGQIVFENPEVANALENCEDLLTESNTPDDILQTSVLGNRDTSCHDIFLLALANDHTLKRVEGCLLRRIIGNAIQCKTADELMAYFDVNKPQISTIVDEEKQPKNI